MNDKIRHIGIVDHISGDCVSVRILQSSACSGCKVAGHCNAAETKEKIIDVRDSNASKFIRGEQVTVVADATVGLRASLYAYILPLLLMIIILITVLQITHSEMMAALSAIGSLLPYYIVLYVFRKKLKSRMLFAIET